MSQTPSTATQATASPTTTSPATATQATATAGAQGPPRGGSGAMFDTIARRYDLLNRLTSLGLDRRWRKRMVECLALPDRAEVLDLATGTADVALAIRAAHPDARVVGIDPSPGMLDIGRDKVSAAGHAPAIRLEVGDACDLDFADHRFDAATIAFGIRNVPDRPAALREMARVVKPGGRVAILELTEPRRGLLARLARVHIHRVVPTLGALVSGDRRGRDAYRYLEASIAAFPAPDAFAGMMASSGLEIEHVQPLAFGSVHLFVARVPQPEESP